MPVPDPIRYQIPPGRRPSLNHQYRFGVQIWCNPVCPPSTCRWVLLAFPPSKVHAPAVASVAPVFFLRVEYEGGS